jgi:YD repeat-containing protein
VTQPHQQNFRVWLFPFQLCATLFFAVYVLSDQAQYLYDDQGRLTSASDSTGATAVYNYDAVGNLLSIDRLTPPGSGIGIYLVNPITGPVSQLCRVQGYGFDPVASNNVVKFNGVTATVSSATAYTLTVVIPAGATTGTVTVTNTNGTANSTSSFTVVGPPTITGLNPTAFTQGTTMPATIQGTNVANATAVTFTQPGLVATMVNGVTSTALPITLSVASTVPPGTYTFSVTTPEGTTASGAVTVTVAQRVPSFALTGALVGVAMPNPQVSTPAMLSGSSFTAAPTASMSMPYIRSASGQATTIGPAVSESMPYVPSASGQATTIGLAVSESMP